MACSTGIADVATAGVSLVAATGISLSGAAPDIVVEFTAMHDFGDGVKGAGFKLKEMGEDGRGSLEPGVASGSEFIMAYLSLLLAPSMEVLRTNKTRAATASWSKSSRRRLPY